MRTSNDVLPEELAEVGFGPQCSHEPVDNVNGCVSERRGDETNHTVATPYLRWVRIS